VDEPCGAELDAEPVEQVRRPRAGKREEIMELTNTFTSEHTVIASNQPEEITQGVQVVPNKLRTLLIEVTQ